MKKIVVCVVAVLLAASSVWAQSGPGDGRRGPQGGRGGQRGERPAMPRQTREKITITGTFKLIDGKPACIVDKKTYYAQGISKLVGSIDGLKEGATITLEGFGMQNPQTTENTFFSFRVTKLTFNGKDYEPERPERPAQKG